MYVYVCVCVCLCVFVCVCVYNTGIVVRLSEQSLRFDELQLIIERRNELNGKRRRRRETVRQYTTKTNLHVRTRARWTTKNHQWSLPCGLFGLRRVRKRSAGAVSVPLIHQRQQVYIYIYIYIYMYVYVYIYTSLINYTNQNL